MTRVPSNRMPALSVDDGLPGWIGTTFSLLTLGVILHPIVSLLLEACLCFDRHCTKQIRLRLTAIATQRPHESICTFARSFDCRRMDTWIIRAVYEGVQQWHGARHLPVRADDALSQLEISDDELEFLADEIADRCGRSLEDTECNPMYGGVQSVRDLVVFLSYQPRVAEGV